MFIARQPIFNKSMEVFGYELLFRSGSHSKGFDGVSSSHATASVIGNLLNQASTKLSMINGHLSILTRISSARIYQSLSKVIGSSSKYSRMWRWMNRLSSALST